jgi:small subunit ribosomal protein S20
MRPLIHVVSIGSTAVGTPALLPSARPRQRAFFRWNSPMPNIKQQKKRVRIAAEERLENLRYRSTIKTLTKRLATAVENGDATEAAEEHRNLVQLIDRAVARGALHRNAGARKKSQAARLLAGPRA